MTLPPEIKAYFNQKDWRPFQFQRDVWRSMNAQQSGLIHSATGTGKTLAAWFGPVIQYLNDQKHTRPYLTNSKHEIPTKKNQASENKKRQKKFRDNAAPLTVLWITPLRALAKDTEVNLQETIDSCGLPWTLERRTGDTSASTRARQRKKFPSALITTPESLSLLLSYKDNQTRFNSLTTVIVDEWHELLSTKRGVQLELCLARLKTLQPNLKVWGVSATIGNLDEAMSVLLGPDTQGQLIESTIKKKTLIKAVLPKTIERFPWAGHLGLKLLPNVIKLVEQANSTLIFTNTRSQAELWFEALLKTKPEWLEVMGLHHGSLSRKVRDFVEIGLRDGNLKLAVCTSSLDLGVDFSPVDQVIQIGSPKGIARLVQRAGRSGHQPGAKSIIHCVPTHAFELIEIAAARNAYQQNQIEARAPLILSLDVLVQHCVTLAIGGGFDEKNLFKEVKKTYCFSGLSESQWQWVLDFITRGGDALQHYPDYQKVIIENNHYKVESKRISQRHRLAIGTITGNSSIIVKWMKGGSLGVIEEAFISRLKPREAFLFNGKKLELVQVRDMTAYVRLAKTSARVVPRWQGGRMPLSTKLGDFVHALIGDIHTQNDDLKKAKNEPEIKAIADLLHVQKNWSTLPRKNELLIEVVKTREGFHIFCYPFAGRSVHEGLSALLAYRLSKKMPLTFSICVNDYGFELLTKTIIDHTEFDFSLLLSSKELLTDLMDSINKSEMARRQFRDIARIAGLVFQGFPGKSKTTRQIQASSSLIYDVLAQYDKNNLLLDQALNEVLVNEIQYSRLQTVLDNIKQKKIVIETPSRLTPFAFPLWAERVRSQIISSEKWQDRLNRMLTTLNKAADK